MSKTYRHDLSAPRAKPREVKEMLRRESLRNQRNQHRDYPEPEISTNSWKPMG